MFSSHIHVSLSPSLLLSLKSMSMSRPGEHVEKGTYCYAEPQYVVLVTLLNDVFQHGAVVRLPVGHNHHDPGSTWPPPCLRRVSEVPGADRIKDSPPTRDVKTGTSSWKQKHKTTSSPAYRA